MEPSSPPRPICCFGYSSKSKTRRKNKGRTGGASTRLETDDSNKGWGNNDEILSDMSTFSVKEQEGRLRKAREDEKRASREAERVVKWVKQESARIDDSVLRSVLNEGAQNEDEPTKK